MNAAILKGMELSPQNRPQSVQEWLNLLIPKPASIEKFPCEDLRTIDELWVKYSNGRFGFSVQKRIYQSLGGTSLYDREIWEKFGDRVGWKKSNKWLSYNV